MSPRRLRTLAETPVRTLKAVPEKKLRGLHQMEIDSVLDLLTHYPRRYVDRRNASEIGALEEEEALVSGTVVRSSSRVLRNRRTMTEIVVDDGSGLLKCVFFNQAWRSKQLPKGTPVTVFGRAEIYRGSRQMAHPIVDLVGKQTGRIVAVYPQSPKARIGSVELGEYVAEALDRSGDFAEPVPLGYRRELNLIERTAAFRGIHRPESDGERLAARRRLAFDELLRLQLLLVMRKRALAAEAKGIAHHVGPGGLVESFLGRLPFALTAAQRRAIGEIQEDLVSPHPMNRLLQGDVGSGKTVVALATLLAAVESGHQGALMVPTEVLAEQHFYSAREMLSGLEVPDATRIGSLRPLMADILTNKTSGADRARVLSELRTGSLDVLVGTHALLTENVEFASLGAVVVDEQHRFGVEQRAALREKAERDPDVLVMTATPIPRSAAMTVYGDLDYTLLDELPPGRTPIKTRWLKWGDEATAWKRVRAELEAGRQAYVLCPLVDGKPEEGDEPLDEEEESSGELDGRTVPSLADPLKLLSGEALERQPPRSVNEETERLSSGPLSGCRLATLHGQLPSKEKDQVMADFRRGWVQVLVATTVIEVGVDVPNATVMVIEDADRFGIAQLHQLRGRVGRGAHASFCFLVSDPVTPLAEARLEAVVRSENGFELAETDLNLRGEGTMLGARQKGRSDLKLARLALDRDLIVEARRVATELVSSDGSLSREEHALLRDELDLFVSDEEREFLFRS